MGHAALIKQPSQLKRTLNCPGWGNMCADIPRKPSGKDALRGSAAHYLAEKCLRQGRDADHLRGREITIDDDVGGLSKHLVDDAMIDGVQAYLNEVNRKRNALIGAEFLVEERLDLSWLVPGMYGTGDHVAIEPLRKLYVDDYKNGYIVVEVDDNPQLMAYALGALGKDNLFMVDEVEVTITQPNAPHPDGPVRSAKYNAYNLYEWGDTVLKPMLEMAQTPDAPLAPGDWCKWCPALQNASCPEVKRRMFEVAEVDDAKGTPTAPGSMSADQLDQALVFAEVITEWVKAAKAEALERHQKDRADKPKNWKMVAGRKGNRKWADESKVYPALKSMLPRKEVFKPEATKSPADIEKALKKAKKDFDITELLAERKPGKPTLVPITDKRQALPPAAETMFPKEK